MPSTVAVLPVKSFGQAKQRLGDAVPDRPVLAAAMVADVIAALATVAELDQVFVVTAEPRAAGPARADGAEIIFDPVEAGQSAAAQRGVDRALADGAQRVLLVPGDCPTLDAGEIRALLAQTAPVVIVPDRHGTGTNALLLTPPDAIEPGFGPGSCARHQERARAAGHEPVLAAAPSLELDVDTPGDLTALRAALEARPGGAKRTRAALAALLTEAV